MDSEFANIRTGIEGLDLLLEGKGIACHRDRGLFGVILGSSGSGKSILGIQMCCSFVLQRLLDYGDKATPCGAVYISQEHPALVKAKILEAFEGFLPNFPDLGLTASREYQFVIEERIEGLKLDQSKPSVYILKLDFDADKQMKTLSQVFNKVRAFVERFFKDQHTDPKCPPAWERMLVCVDNADIIDHQVLTDVLEPVEHFTKNEHLQSSKKARVSNVASHYRTYRELRDFCSQNKIHAFFIFEEEGSRSSGSVNIGTRAEVYAADLALRLGVRTYSPMRYRERYLEILKAKNQWYHRGMHHFSIPERDKPDVKREDRRVGVTIYPSLSTQLYQLRTEAGSQNKGKLEKKHFGLGIDSLDKKICGILHRLPNEGYIRGGSTSVLVSDLDVKASEIALHFALNSLKEGANARMVYISFLHGESDLDFMAQRFGLLENTLREQFVFKYYPPEHISEHKLMRDIDLLLKRGNSHASLVVVLDNVFELQCKYPMLANARHFITALFELFRVRGATSLIVDTVEAGEARNPIEASFAAGLADNVFLLRHVEFQSRPHHVFSILKLVEGPTPEYLWDLEEKHVDNKSRFIAGDTFDLYRNVLSGKPEPINITLTFYMDEKGSPFYYYLLGQTRAIRQSFGKESITINLYGPEEHSRVQNIVSIAAPPQRSGCHIVALDEFWLEQLIDRELLEEIGPLIDELEEEKKEEGMKREYVKGQYASAAHDLALFRRASKGKGKIEDYCDKWYAIPARNNCGILCYDPILVQKILDGKDGKKGKPFVKFTDGWLSRTVNPFTWSNLVGLRKHFENYKKAGKSTAGECPEVFFTFCMDQMESCVSFLLELALSYSREGKGLVDQESSMFMFENIPDMCLVNLVSLLDHRDLERIAQGRFRRSAGEPTALFSRQWMSTLGCLRNRILQENIKEAKRSTHRSGEYFRRIEPFELPKAIYKNHPTPVSGTWYVGILKNSVALRTGVRLLMQFTSVSDEVYKLNNYIGLPVRQAFYENGGKNGCSSFSLPYSKQYVEISKKQNTLLCNIKEAKQNMNQATQQYKDLLYGDYPFYRMSIEDYHYVAPVLWRLMVQTAKKALRGDGYHIKKSEARELICSAREEYEAIRKAAGGR